MTPGGYARLESRLADAKEELARIQLSKGREAIHLGDHWHDNPALYDVESKERVALRRVSELSRRLAEADVIDIGPTGDRAQFGSTVKLEFDDGELITCRLLGSADADLAEGVISLDSAVGRAILGKRKGDRVTFSVNNAAAQSVVILELD
jgi:transcription elongation factor GreA